MATALADTEQYRYDALGRLRSVNSSSGSAIAYTYDAAGNRTAVTSQGPTVPLLNLSCASPTLPTQPVAATQSCTLSNTGPVGASSISYGTITGVNISGPTGACASNTTCGTVTLTSGTTAGTYSGTLTATPNTGIAASVTVSLVVNPPGVQPVLTLSCASSTPQSTPTAATTTCILGNTGSAAASGITYSATAGITASGPVSCAAGSNNCGLVNVSSGTGANTYSGSVTAAPGNGGTSGSANLTLVVNPTLSLTRTPSPMIANQSYTVNWSSAGATSIGYNCIATSPGYSGTGTLPPSLTGSSVGTASKDWVNHPSSCVWTATGPGGTSVTLNETLTTNDPPPALALSCTFNSPTITPTAASADCTLSNNGGYAANPLTALVPAGVTLSGMPANCPRFGPCALIKLVTTSNAANTTVNGSLTIQPNTGTSATASIVLQVNPPPPPPPPALTLSCTSSSPKSTPTPATAPCTLGNTGGTAASGITYTAPAGVAISGPTACAAGNTNCGAVNVTSGTAANNYSGNVTATPGNGGTSGSAYVTLVVNPTITPYRSPSPMVAGQTYNVTWSTVGAISAGYSCTSTGSGFSGTGPLPALNSSSSGTAQEVWVGNPSTCVWTVNGPGGTSATFNETLTTVYPPPALTLSCATNSPTIAPTAATATCTVGNAAGGPASSIVYSAPAGMTASGGPTTCGAFKANCGTVTVSTSTSAGGPYTGSFIATPNTGSAGSASLTLQVIQGSGTFAFVSGTHTARGSAGDIATVVIKNTGNATITGISYVCSGGSFHNYGTSDTSLTAGASGSFLCQAAASGSSFGTISISGSGASNSPFSSGF